MQALLHLTFRPVIGMAICARVGSLALLLLGLLSFSQAQDTIPPSSSSLNATLPSDVNKTTGVLLPNPPAPICEVAIQTALVNSSVSLPPTLQPTASPVPEIVNATMSLELKSLLTTTLQEPYVITVEVPFGVFFSNVSGANASLPFLGTNGTEAVNFTVTTSLAAAAANSAFINMTVVASSQDFSPRTVSLFNNNCAIALRPNITAPVALPLKSGGNNNNLTTFLQTGYVSFSGTRLVGVDGNLLTLNGANWFGFETQSTMVGGLNYPETLRGDFATVAYRIQLLGFNAIRLPMSFINLFQNQPINYTKSCTISTEADIRANVIDPRDAPNIPASANPPLPVNPPTTYGVSGVCNDYVPNDSIYNRFLFVVRYLVRQGFYILIDNHLNSDPTAVNNPATWVAQWTQLMTDIVSDPMSKAMVMVDILNEPDSRGLTWATTGPLYLQVMEAIYAFSPTTLFFIEGMAQEPIQMCYGDGFVTDAGVIAQYGFSDPRPFFDTLLTKPYLNNVGLAPHYYGPSISGQTSNFTGSGLSYRASLSWGSKTVEGYGGHLFPVIIGETGTRYYVPEDLDFYHDFGLYLNDESYENDGQHTVIRDLFWWSWNADSSDTGGIVDYSWTNVIWNKTEYIEDTVGLTPWSLATAQGRAFSLPPTPTPGAGSPPTNVPATSPPPVPATSPPPVPATSTPPVPATSPPPVPATSTPPVPATSTPPVPATSTPPVPATSPPPVPVTPPTPVTATPPAPVTATSPAPLTATSPPPVTATSPSPVTASAPLPTLNATAPPRPPPAATIKPPPPPTLANPPPAASAPSPSRLVTSPPTSVSAAPPMAPSTSPRSPPSPLPTLPSSSPPKAPAPSPPSVPATTPARAPVPSVPASTPGRVPAASPPPVPSTASIPPTASTAPTSSPTAIPSTPTSSPPPPASTSAAIPTPSGPTTPPPSTASPPPTGPPPSPPTSTPAATPTPPSQPTPPTPTTSTASPPPTGPTPSPPTSTPAATPTPPSQPTPPTPTTSTASPAPINPTSPPPTPTPTTVNPTTGSSNGGQPCQVRFGSDSMWQANGTNFAVFQLYIMDVGQAAVTTPYSISLTNPGYTSLQTTWNWQATFASGTVSGSSLANQSWETLLPNSQNTVQVGGIVSYSSSITDVTPTSITVAGAQCSILTAG